MLDRDGRLPPLKAGYSGVLRPKRYDAQNTPRTSPYNHSARRTRIWVGVARRVDAINNRAKGHPYDQNKDVSQPRGSSSCICDYVKPVPDSAVGILDKKLD